MLNVPQQPFAHILVSSIQALQRGAKRIGREMLLASPTQAPFYLAMNLLLQKPARYTLDPWAYLREVGLQRFLSRVRDSLLPVCPDDDPDSVRYLSSGQLPATACTPGRSVRVAIPVHCRPTPPVGRVARLSGNHVQPATEKDRSTTISFPRLSEALTTRV